MPADAGWRHFFGDVGSLFTRCVVSAHGFRRKNVEIARHTAFVRGVPGGVHEEGDVPEPPVCGGYTTPRCQNFLLLWVYPPTLPKFSCRLSETCCVGLWQRMSMRYRFCVSLIGSKAPGRESVTNILFRNDVWGPRTRNPVRFSISVISPLQSHTLRPRPRPLAAPAPYSVDMSTPLKYVCCRARQANNRRVGG